MIDLETERILRLNEARKLSWIKGRRGRRISLDSLRRWSIGGLKGVVLETSKVGTTTVTSIEALLRFVHRLNNAKEKPTDSEFHRRQREMTKAERRLDGAGIK